jgi:hypothetical protein
MMLGAAALLVAASIFIHAKSAGSLVPSSVSSCRRWPARRDRTHEEVRGAARSADPLSPPFVPAAFQTAMGMIADGSRCRSGRIQKTFDEQNACAAHAFESARRARAAADVRSS